jgi:hypothetical protein
LDDDGDLDLVVGANNGTLSFWRLETNVSYTQLNGADNPFNGIDIGALASPCFADLEVASAEVM